ncbi:MAG: ABC transporter substrate-binding protein [Chloroflexota bacterium]
MRAAVRCAPIKAIMFQIDRVTWYLPAAGDIQKIADVKGKRVAVGTIGDLQDALIALLVEREGVSGRDITRIAMSSRNTLNTILSLKAVSFSAVVVNPDESLLGEREGLRTLAIVGDLFSHPFQGFVATDRMIVERPNDIKPRLRSMARALMFVRDRSREATDIALIKIPNGNMTRPLLIEGIHSFAKALPDGAGD